MKKLVLVCLIEAALAGYSVGAVADSSDTESSLYQEVNVKNKVIGSLNHQYLKSGQIISDTAILESGSLVANKGSAVKNITVYSRGEMRLGEYSRSFGLLDIKEGANVYVISVDSDTTHPATNKPAKPGNVILNDVNLEGRLVVTSATTETTPEKADPAVIPGETPVTTINNLKMNGGKLASYSYREGGQYNQLNIENLSGHGTFDISTQLADGMADLINIRQKATGKFDIYILNSGREPTRVTEANIVHINSGDAVFNLSNEDEVVELGSYQYTMKKKSSGEEGTDWYLQGKRKNDTDTDDNGTTAPVLSYSTKGVMAMAAAPRQVLQAESVSLQQRLGNYYSNPQHGYGLWTRYLHDDTRLNDKLNTSFKNKLDGVQIGVDKPFRLDDATVLVGVFTGFSRTKVSTDSYGSGTVESYHGGLYATYLHDNGFYADGMLKGNRLDNENNGRMKNGSSARGDYHQNAFTATIESGFNYEVVPALTVQPYGKLQYARIGSADYELNNGMRADVHSADSLQGEAGTLISTSFDVNSAVLKPYARLAIVHEFTKENDVTINRTNTVSNDFSGSTGKYGLGLDAQITPQAAFYTEINYLNGNKTETPLRADVGFRVRF
ncbi:MAG TPA: autotransporter outer membrane beta-barrel domain-containing protein [Morganella sp. (in: Bacteria)]|nr:autotransporter outer membrane beta-barrel domain-containing protein [Morganella sp. (in: enterobacteria)]